MPENLSPTFDLATVGTLDGDALDVLCQLLIDLDEAEATEAAEDGAAK